MDRQQSGQVDLGSDPKSQSGISSASPRKGDIINSLEAASEAPKIRKSDEAEP